jgi:hypothetical protein
MVGRRRVLLGQLAANGDCVYATTIARQIKTDFPGCHLTWAIASIYRQVIEHNPHVDEIWEIPCSNRSEVSSAWFGFERQARERQARGEFTDLFLTQIHPNNWHNFDGTVRASIFRGYPHPITVPVTPVIRLTAEEIERVRAFARDNNLEGGGPVVLFECAALSGQSFVTPQWAGEVSRAIVARLPQARVVLTSGFGERGSGLDAIDAGGLGFREVAELTRYCSLLIGCSSGLTWLCTSDAARPIPMIQVLTGRVGMYGSVVDDLEHWGLSADQVIEMRDVSAEHTALCAVDVLTAGVAHARPSYHQDPPFHLGFYYDVILALLRRGEVVTVAKSLRCAMERYGARKEFLTEFVSALASDVKTRFGRLAR